MRNQRAETRTEYAKLVLLSISFQDDKKRAVSLCHTCRFRSMAHMAVAENSIKMSVLLFRYSSGGAHFVSSLCSNQQAIDIAQVRPTDFVGGNAGCE